MPILLTKMLSFFNFIGPMGSHSHIHAHISIHNKINNSCTTNDFCTTHVDILGYSPLLTVNTMPIFLFNNIDIVGYFSTVSDVLTVSV